MRFKKGDRVLADLEVQTGDDYGDACWMWLPGTNRIKERRQIARDKVHPHPGDWEIEHVAEMKREIELLWKRNPSGVVVYEVTPDNYLQTCNDTDELNHLRKNREAANKPQYTEGQELWVRNVVQKVLPDGSVECLYARAVVHPDDIRPVREDNER